MEERKKTELLDVSKAETPFEEEIARKVNEILIELAKLGEGDKTKSKFEAQEKKEEILDEAEKEYLRAVIKPFREKYHTYITKQKIYAGDERVQIYFIKYTVIKLPFFKAGTMYKGMELDKEYSLEELGL